MRALDDGGELDSTWRGMQRDRPTGDVIATTIDANDAFYDQEPLAAVA
jgi:hypothetical protein